MKVLLFGEFSSVHNYISKALRELNHDAITISSGDYFKKIKSDINYTIYPIKGTSTKKVLAGFKNILTYIKLGVMIKNYDIVQLIHPAILPNLFVNNLLIWLIKKRNKKLVLFSGGLDYRYYLSSQNHLKYSSIDWPLRKCHYNPFVPSKKWVNTCIFVENACDLIIPAYYSCRIGYVGSKKLFKTIPLPVDTSIFQYKDNVVVGKIKIYHGISRPAEKGTALIMEACKTIKKKYPDSVEIITTTRISTTEFIKTLSDCNIYIDACIGDAYGISALMSMALGKITLSGCWPEALADFGIPHSPIVHIGPYVNEIVDRLSEIIEKNDFLSHGKYSRAYVKQFHDSNIIAGKYVDAWKSIL